MAKRTNVYHGPSSGHQGADGPRRGVLSRLASRHGPTGRRTGAPRRRDLALLLGLLVAVPVALACLVGGWLLYQNDHDWAVIATVNGHDISRESLRARMDVLELLADQRTSFIAERATAGDMTDSEGEALSQAASAPLSDLVDAARESLIDDELLRQLAARDGVPTPASPDPWEEAARYASSDDAQLVRYVQFEIGSATSAEGTGQPEATSPAPWPAADEANVSAATERLRAELNAGTQVTVVVEGLADAGWQVVGEDVAISEDGVAADANLTMDPSIAAAALRGEQGDVVGPVTDAYGRVSMAGLLGAPDTSHLRSTFPSLADEANVDTAAIQSWADGRALQRAVRENLLSSWSKDVDEAHFREVVIGAAPDSSATAGPWVEISTLATDRLSAVDPASILGAPSGLDLGADALAKTLASLSPTDRISLFRALVAAANASPAASGTNSAGVVSGELGFFTKDEIETDVGKAAFAEGVQSGDVIGPVATATGPVLYLVEARYAGSLDDRARAALSSIRSDPDPDLAAYAKQYSPDDAALASGADPRAEPEFASSDSAVSALFDTPIGLLSDPFILEGKLAVAVVDERTTQAPDARTLDRLSLDGYDSWFASELAKATITRSDNPLPELEPSSSPSQSASPAASEPVMPSLPVLDTPNLPELPGQEVPTAVPTDVFGLPVLP